VENLNLEGTVGKELFMFGKHLMLSGKVDGEIKMKGILMTIESLGPGRKPNSFRREQGAGSVSASEIGLAGGLPQE